LGGYLPDVIIDQVRSGNDIVSIISDYVSLKKQGRNYVGLCPFHHEKTPSFMVSQDKQIFRCFGCGEGGNVITFVMKRESLSFPEAVRMLAQKAGISIPEEAGQEQSEKLKELERSYKLNELVKDFYHYILLNHQTAKEARQYLSSRGITPQTVERFQLGYAPLKWDSLLEFLKKKGHSPVSLEKLGLVLPRTKGRPGYYDRFRNRVMFPVFTAQGKVAGFGGRVLDESIPKYLNSPETMVFNKGNLLYGLNRAIDGIRSADQVIIVEGYLDVISCHQAGVTNVVASLGTALTRDQGKLLSRYTREVVMAYDADTAGVKATLKGWQLLDDLGCKVKVVNIPDGKDPDDFIQKHGSDEFLELINKKALSLWEYQTDRAMEKFDIYTLEGKFKIASEVIPNIRNLSNEIEKDEAIIKLARRLQLSPEAIRAEVEKNAHNARNSWSNRDKITDLRDNNNNHFAPKVVSNQDKDARSKAEDVLLAMMLDDKSVFLTVKEKIGIIFSESREYLNIIGLLNEMAEKGIDYQPAALFDRTEDQDTLALLGKMMSWEVPAENKLKVMEDCLKTIREDENRKKREELLRLMEEADRNRDQELRNRLLMEYSRLL